MLATVAAEAIRTAGDRGPATVVRRFDSPQMIAAVAALANQLNLSGLCGLDFMHDEVDGCYYLIEINARATPTCHLMGTDGVDLLAALRAAMVGEAPAAGEKATAGETIALFPQEMMRDPDSPYLAAARHDVPSQADFLVQAGLAAVTRYRRMDALARYVRFLAWTASRLPGNQRPPGAEEAAYRSAKASA